MYSQNEINQFVILTTGVRELRADDDLFSEHGIYGDDFHELMDGFEKKFHVDMTGYKWYFHTHEEGTSIGGLFFTPPDKQVKRIPVTTSMLCDFANSGTWGLKYPPHELPKNRWDIIINMILIGLIGIWILYMLFK